MNRAEIESVVREMYSHRLSNSVEDCVACFAPHSMFELCGSSDSSPIPCRCEGDHDALRDILTVLVNTWRWTDIEYRALVIDGDQVSVRYNLTTEFVPLNEVVTTQVLDHLVVREGLIVSLSEFVDTAMVASLAARAEANEG